MGVSEIEEGLYISDVDYVKNHDIEDEFNIVITVCRGDPVTIDGPVSWQQFELWDDDVSNQQQTFDNAVTATLKAMESYPTADVLVHCIAGQSRSPAVVATAIAYRDDLHFDEARDVVWEARPTISIHPALREHGLEFLDQEDRKPFN